MSMYKKYIGASDEEVIEMVKSDFGPEASEHLKRHGYLSLQQANEYAVKTYGKDYLIRDLDENVGFILIETAAKYTEAKYDVPYFN